MNAETQIASNLVEIQSSIRYLEKIANSPPGFVTLIAISKNHPIEYVRPLLDVGHRIFGENRVQEMLEKWPILREQYEDIQLHLVGALQSNKARLAVQHFDVIETLDRPSLAKELAKTMDKFEKRPDCFIQINTGEEKQKTGVLPKEADNFIKSCREEFELPVTGLMCIPPKNEEPSPHFVFLSQIAERNGLSNLSMGMSSDYLVAIRFGATHVRLGTALFGDRKSTEN